MVRRFYGSDRKIAVYVFYVRQGFAWLLKMLSLIRKVFRHDF